LTRDQVEAFRNNGWLKYRHHSTFDVENMPDDRVYSIRMLTRRERKIFPLSSF